MQRTELATYLGVEIDSNGIGNEATTRRISSARRRIRELSELSLLGTIHPMRARSLYVSLVQPVFEYAIHLTLISPLQKILICEAERLALAAPPKETSERAFYCIRTLYGLCNTDTRRNILAARLWQRLKNEEETLPLNSLVCEKWIIQPTFHTIESIYSSEDLLMPTEKWLEMRRSRENTLRRNRPVGADCVPANAIMLHPKSLATFATLWYISRFPSKWPDIESIHQLGVSLER